MVYLGIYTAKHNRSMLALRLFVVVCFNCVSCYCIGKMAIIRALVPPIEKKDDLSVDHK